MAYQLKNEEGEIVKHDGNEVFAADSVGSVKAINKEDRTLVIVGSDETKDRDGDIITVSGWELGNFLKNPVFLYGHNHSGVPIGSATKVVRRKNPARLEFHEKFPSEGIYPFADMILALFQEKVLNASSVGFIPLKWEDLPKEEGELDRWYPGRKYLKQELLELSAVSVPSNPSALQVNSLAKSFLEAPLDKIKEMMSPKERDIILEQLFIKEIEFEDEDRSLMVQVPEQIVHEKDEEFMTVKGEAEHQEGVQIGEEEMDKIKEMLKEMLVDISGQLKATQEKTYGAFELVHDKVKELEVKIGTIETFILNLTKTDETPPDPEDKQTGDLYEDILSRSDNKDVEEDDGLGLTDDERKVLLETIQSVKAELLKNKGE